MYQRTLDLKKELQRRRKDNLLARHSSESEDIGNAYQEELSTHNSQWQEKLKTFKQSCIESEDQLVKRQASEYEALKKNLEESIPVIPKHSPELLNLKRIQDTLVRNKEYREAHVVQQQMFDLEEKLKQTWGLERETKIQRELAAIAKRHENELASFKQKLVAGAEELKKLRAVEYDSLIKKYQNFKKELVITHKLEQNRFDGKHTTGCGVTGIDLNQSSRAIFRTPYSSRPGTVADSRSFMAKSFK